MHLKNSILSSLTIALICIISACHSVKPAGGKYKASDYESFFLGDGKTQYFIQPINFNGEDSNLDIDFTFRDENFIDSLLVTNYTVSSEFSITKIDSIVFITSDSKIKATQIQKIFQERDGKKHRIRSTCKITGSKLAHILKSNNLQISIFAHNKELKFESSKKVNAKRQRIYSNLIESIVDTL